MFDPDSIPTAEVQKKSVSEKAWALAEKLNIPGIQQLRQDIDAARRVAKEAGVPILQAYGVMALNSEGMNQAVNTTQQGGGPEGFLNSAKQFGKDLLHAGFPNKVGINTAIGGIAGGVALTAIDAAVTKKPGLLKTAAYMTAGAAIGNRFD